MKTIKPFAITGGLVLILSMLFTTWMSHRRNTIETVDLGKIMSAQMLIAGRMVSQGNDKALWMSTVKDASSNLKKTISDIAGDHIVIVTPAVVQGAHDITNEVLKRLGLPTHVPKLSIPKANVVPDMIPREKVTTNDKEEVGKPWQLP